MQIVHCIIFPILLPALTTALAPTRLIYEAPIGTWLENLAVRTCGSILLTTITSPDLWLINPLSPTATPKLLHRFPRGLETLGITETTPDTFHLVVANATRNINRIYTLTFPPSSDIPSIDLTATIPNAKFLNGLTTLTATTILAADSTKGAVWAIDTLTGASRILLSDPLMAPLTAPPLYRTIGINGLKLRSSTLYFTNTAQALYAKIKLHHDGTALGAANVIARAPPNTVYDDFALDGRGNAFLATAQGNAVEEVGRTGELRMIVAGNVNGTEIAEPTAAQFGRTRADGDVLYVTTAGGLGAPVNGDEIVGGQLVAVEIKRRWRD